MKWAKIWSTRNDRKLSFSVLVLIFALFFVISPQFQAPFAPAITKVKFGFNEGRYTLSPNVARVGAFGYGHALSSILWIRFLQETPPQKGPKNASSWIYQDLNTITTLDPDYIPAFSEGALFLSVITEDTAGAEKILKRGTLLHPESASVLGAMAYHYHFEMNDPDRAGPYYIALSKLPNVPYLYSIMASSFLQRSGDTRAGLSLLRAMLGNTKDPDARKRIEDKIQKLEAEETKP